MSKPTLAKWLAGVKTSGKELLRLTSAALDPALQAHINLACIDRDVLVKMVETMEGPLSIRSEGWAHQCLCKVDALIPEEYP